jgi:hypothetical protein
VAPAVLELLGRETLAPGTLSQFLYRRAYMPREQQPPVIERLDVPHAGELRLREPDRLRHAVATSSIVGLLQASARSECVEQQSVLYERAPRWIGVSWLLAERRYLALRHAEFMGRDLGAFAHYLRRNG